MVVHMLPTALVPIRTGAKRRLAHAIAPEPRRRLVEELFDHVVGVLRTAGLRTIALSPTPPAETTADEVWLDAATGLNAALDRAVRTLGPPVLIVHADLPAIGVQDVHALLATSGDVVIARARDGGTNALFMREAIRCSFGPSSAVAHARRARERGLRAVVVDRPGLALDVDDEASLTLASKFLGSSFARPRPPL